MVVAGGDYQDVIYDKLLILFPELLPPLAHQVWFGARCHAEGHGSAVKPDSLDQADTMPGVSTGHRAAIGRGLLHHDDSGQGKCGIWVILSPTMPRAS